MSFWIVALAWLLIGCSVVAVWLRLFSVFLADFFGLPDYWVHSRDRLAKRFSRLKNRQ